MNLRDYIGAISRVAAEKSMKKRGREVITSAARSASQRSGKFMKDLGQMAVTSRRIDEELARWAEPDELGKEGGRKRFDVCDLRIWLKLAEAAGVAAVPAREVASLKEEELEALLGSVSLPKGIRERLSEGLKEGVSEIGELEDGEVIASFMTELFKPGISRDEAASAYARLEGALDDIPSSWMVRTQYSGSGNLKALVGTGLMLKADDTAQIRPGFELGGGWVRAGNRRMIDFSDPRFLQLAIGGHKPGVTYLARPWAQPARFHEGEDLHRANTPLAGPGKWPAEWRVFVRAGRVTGVANYYGWTGEGATPLNAWNAVHAAMLGQRIADTAESLGLTGHFIDQVLLRQGQNKAMRDALNDGWPEEKLTCSLDFIETEEGLRLLEGGPGHMPGGGGHPCAFAGQGTVGHPMESPARCEGVAYVCMPHVSLADPRTWADGDQGDSIHGWAQAAGLARRYAPLEAGCEAFLDELGAGPEAHEPTL